MDDSMDSVLSEDHGIELYKHSFTIIIKSRYARPRKWLSSSSEVIGQIQVSDRKSEVYMNNNELPCAKTLGVWWLVQEDVFIPLRKIHLMETERKFLKKVATLFYPLGLLAPYTFRAKNIVTRDVDCRFRLG